MMKKISRLKNLILPLMLIILLTSGFSCENDLLGLISEKEPMYWAKEDVMGGINNIINWLIGGAGTIAIIFIMIGGVQYIISLGNPEQNQKAKTTLTYAVIGLILVLGAYAIIKLLLRFLRG